jgi:hypothetical protein
MDKVRIEPYELCQKILCLRGEPFDLQSYPYLRAVYNTNCREVGLFTGRQVAKSTLLASQMVTHAVTNPNSSQIYISPLQDQAEVFSTQRLKDFLVDSPIVKNGFFSGKNVIDQVFRKMLSNNAIISCGYAQRTADRLRGRSAGKLRFDEIQDIQPDVIPVIKELAFRVVDPSYWYCGTPKSLGNHMEAMRARSTGAEWAVRCQATGCKKWNMTWTEKNIGDKGVICEHCGAPLDTNQGQWVAARRMDWQNGKNATVTMESYRIPQLIVKPIMSDPYKWRELLTKLREYSTAQFYNEVLGLPYDSGMQPVTLAQLMACTQSGRVNKLPDPNDQSVPPLVMGVDWAFIGENSYTVLVIGAWNPYPTHFDVYYYHVFKGAEADVEFQINEIIRLANQCRINIIGADWGAGHVQNIKLVNALGEHRVAQMWHTGMQGRGKTQRAKWEPKTRKWHLARTAVLTDTYETLRQGRCRLPRAEDCQLMFDHLLAISMEYNEKTNLTQYVHIKPDDCAHALTFAMLAGELLIRGDFGGHGATPTVTPGGVPAPDHPDGWGVSDSYYQ